MITPGYLASTCLSPASASCLDTSEDALAGRHIVEGLVRRMFCTNRAFLPGPLRIDSSWDSIAYSTLSRKRRCTLVGLRTASLRLSPM